MKRPNLQCIIIASIVVPTTVMFAQTEVTLRKINPFTSIGTNALHSVSGYNLLWQTGGIAATYLIVNTDIDRRVHNYSYENINTFDPPSVPAVYIGYFAPLILGSSLYLNGIFTDDMKNACAGSAVLQSAFLAFIESSTLKAFTGRQNPDRCLYSMESDKSANFQFGFMKNGIHYGWPSGHLSASTAVVSCLAVFYSNNRLIRYSSWAAWAYMFVGVSVHEGNTMHWFSDVVAGSMMGYAIGNTVGKNFKKLYDNGKEKGTGTTWNISPQIGKNTLGMQMNVKF